MALVSAGADATGRELGIGRLIAVGALWGIVGGVAMAMYAMAAGATYLETGFFTPKYHIASTFIAPTAMMTSMERAMEGEQFYFSFGPAALGMMIHLAVGAAYGIVFVLLARALNVSGLVAVVAGVIYGVAVLLFSSFVGLPIAASLFGGGAPIADMPTMVGWPTFTIEHVLFGLVMGLAWVGVNRAAPMRARSVGP